MSELIPAAVRVTVFGLMFVVGLDCTLGNLRHRCVARAWSPADASLLDDRKEVVELPELDHRSSE
jgi:hypothetical protein